MKKILIIVVAVLGAAWLYFRYRQPSPLEKDMAEHNALARIGMAVNDIMLKAIPPIGTIGKLPLTGSVVVKVAPQPSPGFGSTDIFPQTTDISRAQYSLSYEDWLAGKFGTSPALIWN